MYDAQQLGGYTVLINDDNLLEIDAIYATIAKVNGLPAQVTRLADGVYEICHFGGSDYPNPHEYDHYPTLTGGVGCYGVCDNYAQILERAPLIQSSDRKFVITLTPVHKANQTAQGGWRWHKWGAYIGNHEPKHEYLYDEEDIDTVYVYHVFEKIN